MTLTQQEVSTTLTQQQVNTTVTQQEVTGTLTSSHLGWGRDLPVALERVVVHFGQSVGGAHHDLVQLGVPQAADNALWSEGGGGGPTSGWNCCSVRV